MSKLLSIIILCVGVSIHANAQSYTERVQQKQQGKGTVTIHQSKEIDDLVNDPTATGVQTGNQKPQASNQKPQTSSQTPAANNQQPQANNQQRSGTDNHCHPQGDRLPCTGFRWRQFA